MKRGLKAKAEPPLDATHAKATFEARIKQCFGKEMGRYVLAQHLAGELEKSEPGTAAAIRLAAATDAVRAIAETLDMHEAFAEAGFPLGNGWSVDTWKGKFQRSVLLELARQHLKQVGLPENTFDSLAGQRSSRRRKREGFLPITGDAGKGGEKHIRGFGEGISPKHEEA
jgi:hypothetical protein